MALSVNWFSHICDADFRQTVLLAGGNKEFFSTVTVEQTQEAYYASEQEASSPFHFGPDWKPQGWPGERE